MDDQSIETYHKLSIYIEDKIVAALKTDPVLPFNTVEGAVKFAVGYGFALGVIVGARHPGWAKRYVGVIAHVKSDGTLPENVEKDIKDIVEEFKF